MLFCTFCLALAQLQFTAHEQTTSFGLCLQRIPPNRQVVFVRRINVDAVSCHTSTLIRRCANVMTLHWHFSDVVQMSLRSTDFTTTLYKRHDVASTLLRRCLNATWPLGSVSRSGDLRYSGCLVSGAKRLPSNTSILISKCSLYFLVLPYCNKLLQRISSTCVIMFASLSRERDGWNTVYKHHENMPI